MTRAEAAAVVGTELASLLAEASMTAADSTGNLKEPLDRALRSLGTAEADLATAAPGDAEGFLALALVEALRTVRRRLGDRFAVSVDGGSYQLRQVFENAGELLAEAEGQARALFGGTLPGANGGVVTLDLNFLGGEDAPW